jgi:transposase
MGSIHVLSGPERRRRWSDEQKVALIAAAFAPGAVVSAVARQADICASQLYRWRREREGERPGFAEIVVVANGPSEPGSADPVIEVEFEGRVRLRIPTSTAPELASAIVTALSRRRVCRSPGEGR